MKLTNRPSGTGGNARNDEEFTMDSSPKKSFVRLDPDASEEEREAAIMEWLIEILGPPSDAPTSPSSSVTQDRPEE